LSLCPDLAAEPSSHKDITKHVLTFADPPAPFTQSCGFEEGEEFESASELDMNITTEAEHHNFKE